MIVQTRVRAALRPGIGVKMFDIKYVPFENSLVIKIRFYYNGEPIQNAIDTFIVSAKEDVDKVIALINDKAYGIKCMLWDETPSYKFERITYNIEIGFLSEHLIKWREFDIINKIIK